MLRVLGADATLDPGAARDAIQMADKLINPYFEYLSRGRAIGGRHHHPDVVPLELPTPRSDGFVLKRDAAVVSNAVADLREESKGVPDDFPHKPRAVDHLPTATA